MGFPGTLGTYGACTGRSRSLWSLDRERYVILTTLELFTYIGFHYYASAT
ncbi:hypothetical protein Hanom_Chr17g01578871 [Helianthus anomalus]